ncbi:MAG: Ig-like domain-containing protein [Pedobacter sp.]|nr:Ig-like domain-containing protein [Pedobacter sp.]
MLVSACFFLNANAQVCGTSGIDGPSTNTNPINTYFPVAGNRSLLSGEKSILLEAVPPTDAHSNNYGNIGIRPGDLILIIQMQDALINYNNDNRYGSGLTNSGTDNLGGTGYTDIGFSGKFEYVIALNAVPITGGTLNFRGGGVGGGIVNEYVNAAPTNTRGQRRFQIVRVPQYSNLTLTSDVTTVPYNGKAGGVIAFDVAGDMNFNGFKIDASEKGFRGGFGPVAGSANNTNSVYVTGSGSTTSVGKGEGIAGTPRYMFDGYKDFDNIDEGLPGGSYGKGAPANGGGGGNDHNAGGGGGGNGGHGGVGGLGWEGHTAPNTYPNGGRPGSLVPLDITRLIMGGGGGGGDANNATTGVKGGVGGGIILVNVEKITGAGTIISNGGEGQPGVYGSAPDGAGGGGAGGTIFVRALANSAGATLTIQAHGGKGGNTLNDNGNEHGPGGGGGGGVVYHNVPGAVVNATVTRGNAGMADDGNGTSHGAEHGTVGQIVPFTNASLPIHLQGGGQICYPELTTVLTEQNPGIPGSRNPGTTATYTLTLSNSATGGNAGGVQTELKLPVGFTVTSITANLSGGTTGATNPTVNLSGGIYYIGSTNLVDAYNIPPGGQVSFTINVDIANNVAEGMHHASAQSTYLDPTRTSLNPNRRVTAKSNAFAASNTSYETGNAGDVDGLNYNGDLVAATGEDVHINAKPIPADLEVDVIECDTKAEGTLTATDPDAAHTAATLTYTLEGTYDTSKGALTLNTDGTFLFVPATRFFGTITIQFRVTDPLGAYHIGELTINQPQPLLNITETITHISAYGANDGAISVVSSGGVGVRTYSWLYPDGSVNTSQNISNLAPGQYELTIKDENNCEYTEPYIIREPPLVTLLPSPSVCVGEITVVLPYTTPRVNPTTYSIVWDSAALAGGLANVTDATLPSVVPPATSANINISVPANITVNTYNGILRVKNAAGDASGDIPFYITITPYPLKAHIQLVQ